MCGVSDAVWSHQQVLAKLMGLDWDYISVHECVPQLWAQWVAVS